MIADLPLPNEESPPGTAAQKLLIVSHDILRHLLPGGPARIPVHPNSFRAEDSMAHKLPRFADTAPLSKMVAQQWYGQTSQYRALRRRRPRRRRPDKIGTFSKSPRRHSMGEKQLWAVNLAGGFQAVTRCEGENSIKEGQPVGIYLDLEGVIAHRIPHIRASEVEPLLWDSKAPIRVLEENLAKGSHGRTGWEGLDETKDGWTWLIVRRNRWEEHIGFGRGDVRKARGGLRADLEL